MKRVFALLLALVLVFALAACGGKEKADAPAAVATSNKVAEYVQANKAALLAEMEESFATSSGMTCTSSITTEGNGIVISININELDNVDQEIKDQMQDAYDQMNGVFVESLKLMQQEVPEIESMKIKVCEKDGDVLATIFAKN